MDELLAKLEVRDRYIHMQYERICELEEKLKQKDELLKRLTDLINENLA